MLGAGVKISYNKTTSEKGFNVAEEKTNFDYKTDSDQKSLIGGDSISWTASEYIEHSREASWYVGLTIGTLVLSGLMYLLTRELFATAIIIILGIIVASVAHRKPRKLDYQITSQGLNIGDKSYSYKEFRSFALVEEGPLSCLMFIPLKRFAAPLTMYLEKDDEQNIVSLIGEHIPMEQRSPDRIDTLSRRLRF